MKYISVVVPEGETSISNIEAVHKLFTKVNEFLEMQGRQPAFSVQLVGQSKETKVTNGLFTVYTDKTINDNFRSDLVIIPALHGKMPDVLEENKAFIPWIKDQYAMGAEIASLCIGAFMLAATGLLDNKQCSTHWLMADEFRRMYPQVNLVPDKVITDEQGVYSSGGAYSSLNLLLYLLEKYSGRNMAVFASKIFEIDIERDLQSPFIMFRGQKEHEDEVIAKTQVFIENNYTEKITVDQLASMFALSRRNLERRFKKATSNSIVEYMQRVRIEAAKMSLESSRENVNEVMYKTGYTDPKAFRTTFKKITGLSPLQYRKKYNRDAIAYA